MGGTDIMKQKINQFHSALNEFLTSKFMSRIKCQFVTKFGVVYYASKGNQNRILNGKGIICVPI